MWPGRWGFTISPDDSNFQPELRTAGLKGEGEGENSKIFPVVSEGGKYGASASTYNKMTWPVEKEEMGTQSSFQTPHLWTLGLEVTPRTWSNAMLPSMLLVLWGLWPAKSYRIQNPLTLPLHHGHMATPTHYSHLLVAKPWGKWEIKMGVGVCLIFIRDYVSMYVFLWHPWGVLYAINQRSYTYWMCCMC